MKEKTLDEVYAQVPHIACKGLCTHECSSITFFGREAQRLKDSGMPLPMVTGGGWCTALTEEGKCSIYEYRPIICRLWGVTEGMPCPHGCKAERMITDDEANILMEKVARLSTGLKPHHNNPAATALLAGMMGLDLDVIGKSLEEMQQRLPWEKRQ